MTTQPDFEELLRLLEENRVEYMIVGGYAVAFHGYPRFTQDIDIFYNVSPDNIERLRAALVCFGFEASELNTEIFTKPDSMITFGIAPCRVDFLASIDGVTFEEARPHAIRGRYGNQKVTFIGRAELIKNKGATTRPKDKLDLEELTNPQQGNGDV